jgi:DNA invertase Pin-like site-specific DNA recombinase
MAEEKIMLKNLEILKNAHGMSVDELMSNFGYSRDTYYRAWQKGNIKRADIIKLHELFNVSTDCILDVVPLTISG